MIYDIKNGDLVITPNHIKIEILKDISKEKKLINSKFMTLEELKKRLFPSYDEKAIYYLMKNYNFKYPIAKEYLENIYVDQKKIKVIYKELEERKLLIHHKLQNYKRIIIIGYNDIEPYIKEKLDNKDVIYVKEKQTKYAHKICEFQTMENEIVYTASKISHILKKIKPQEIKLVISSEEYLVELKRIFKMYNIPLYIKASDSIYSTQTVQFFLRNLKQNKNIEKSLDSIVKNETYNLLIDALNRLTFIKEIDNTFIELLENILKNTNKKKNKLENAIEVINYDEIHDKSKYYYILGLNQNIIPKIYTDTSIIEDREKKQIGMFTSIEKNKQEKEKVMKILTTYPNMQISYKLEDTFNSYYPSSIIDNFEIEKPNPELLYSNTYNKLLLSALLDSYINYGQKDDRIEYLYKTYEDLDYRTYKNTYKKISSEKLEKYLKGTLTLSYSSINNYFLCPFKFYIENILKLNKEPDTFKILIGNISHYILQNMYSKSFDIDKLFTNYIEGIKLTNRESFFIKKLKHILKEATEVIKMQDNESEFKERITEKKLVIEKTRNMHVTFTGIIDKISKLDNYIIITDYKTGSNFSNLDNIDDGLNMQLPTYIYLIKKGLEEDYKIVGFYLQKIINNTKIDEQKDTVSDLKLNGYTIDDEKIIEKIDHTYENSKIIKGMKKTKTSFYKYTKLYSKNDIEKIVKIVDNNIEKVIKSVEESDFKINPKRLKQDNISCKYCNYKDLCFYEEEDLTTLKQKPFNQIVGDKDAKLD